MTNHDNSGVLFRNENYVEGGQKPRYQGSVMVNGVQYWISAWVKEGQKGKFFSLAFKPKEGAPPQRSAPRSQPQAPPEDSEDVPF